MQTFKLGDRVAVLHETLKGTVIDIGSSKAKIKDIDGFVWEYKIEELVPQEASSKYTITEKGLSKDKIRRSPKFQKSSTKLIKANQVSEIDLHIEELRDDHRHLTNFQIVQIQMTACRAFIQDSLAYNRKKVVLIHGKGEGVLQSEIHSYLDRLSNYSGSQLEYNDASYQRYGIGGATEVFFYA